MNAPLVSAKYIKYKYANVQSMFTYVIYKDINTYREKGRVCRRARRWKKEKKEYLYCKNLHIIFRGLC